MNGLNLDFLNMYDQGDQPSDDSEPEPNDDAEEGEDEDDIVDDMDDNDNDEGSDDNCGNEPRDDDEFNSPIHRDAHPGGIPSDYEEGDLNIGEGLDQQGFNDLSTPQPKKSKAAKPASLSKQNTTTSEEPQLITGDVFLLGGSHYI